MKLILSTLAFFNLLDKTNNLSITNVAVITLLIKMSISPFEWATAAGLLVTLLNYAHKRSASNGQALTLDSALQAQIQEITSQVQTLQSDHDESLKVLAEAKKIISNSNLAQAFTKR